MKIEQALWIKGRGTVLLAHCDKIPAWGTIVEFQGKQYKVDGVEYFTQGDKIKQPIGIIVHEQTQEIPQSST